MPMYVLTAAVAEACPRCPYPVHYVPCPKLALVAARPRAIVTRTLAMAKQERELQSDPTCLDNGHDSDTCLSTSAFLM